MLIKLQKKKKKNGEEEEGQGEEEDEEVKANLAEQTKKNEETLILPTVQ